MNSLFPDDKAITAVCVVEDLNKCPKGFKAIIKAYDADIPADLGKENSFFAKKSARYLCISKTESIADYVLEDLKIINEKDLPPEGYGLIPRTMDSDQRSWRKKQLCYKLSRQNRCPSVITDIVILINTKRGAPDGFDLVGELNGMLICIKSKSAAPVGNNIASNISAINGYPKLNGENIVNGNGLVQSNDKRYYQENNNHDYENLVVKPIRPAPSIPVSIDANQCNSSNSYCQGLQGVPFMLNTRLEVSSKTLLDSLPPITIKTKEDIENEYFYDFKTEKQLCLF